MNNDNQCSEEFSDAFDANAGACRQVCCCGREWYDNANDGISWEEGEFERLEERSKTDSEKCLPAGGSVGWMEIDSRIIVWGCRCDTAKKYEGFILRHQTQLADYLRRRAVRLKKEMEAIAL